MLKHNGQDYQKTLFIRFRNFEKNSIHAFNNWFINTAEDSIKYLNLLNNIIPSSWSSVNKNQICIEWVCSLNSSGFNMSLQNSFGCIHFCRCAFLFPSPIFMLYSQSFIGSYPDNTFIWNIHVFLKTNPFELKLY